MTRIECRVQGTDVTTAITELANQVNARGGAMFMADPEKVAEGMAGLRLICRKRTEMPLR